MHFIQRCSVPLAIFTMLATTAAAGTRTITIKEHLDRDWSNEYVSYEFTTKKGQCHPDSISLKGPKGSLPVQLSDIENWPNSGHVKSATLSFVVDKLPKLSSLSYTVSYGPKASTAKSPSSDLKLDTTEKEAMLRTGTFGVRLLLGGETYDTPRPAKDVPGAVKQLMLPDGTWFGGSHLYGDARIKSWTSAIEEDGAVFAKVKTVYTYDDGDTLTLATRLIAGDYAALMDMEVSADKPDDGWELRFGKGVTLTGATSIWGQRNYTRTKKLVLKPGSDPICNLCSWPGDVWFPANPSTILFQLEDKKEELVVAVRYPGSWVEPQKRPVWSNFTKWSYDGIGVMWAGWMNKMVPMKATEDGAVLRFNLRKGLRKWSVGATAEGDKYIDHYKAQFMSLHGPQPRLNEVKDMVLEWPHKRLRHPTLYMDAKQLAAAGDRNQKAYKDTTNVTTARSRLNTLGAIDLMRVQMDVAGRYDAVIDSGLTPEDRKLFRAQMAYIAYVGADPFHWSFERGQCSGNPNMTASRVINQGITGCVLRDHPMGKIWADQAIDWMTYWLENVTDEKGYWPESSHYARVSWADFVQFAIAARKAGFHDFFKNPKFKAMALFYEKILTPQDPLRPVRVAGPRGTPPMHPRVCPPYGRGTRGGAWGLSGLVAAATVKSDPELSRVMQWSWRGSCFVHHFSHSPAGLSSLYVNPHLPATIPDWRTERFPSLGYLFRDSVGTSSENYLLFLTEYYHSPDGELWPPDTGAISKWFARGIPIGGSFRRIPETSVAPLINRVMPACNWDPKAGKQPDFGYITKTTHSGFAALGAADYANVLFDIQETGIHHVRIPKDTPALPHRKKEGKLPLQWRRQVLRAKGSQADDTTYVVMRDTVTTKEPTQWHFWTLSEKIGTPADAANRSVFLKDKPGAKVAPARELKGDRFTALGQFSLDLEYFVAAPRKTPRFTMRYGTRGSAYAVRNFNEYQDLLHLQLPRSGSYFVAMFPRDHDAAAPEFESLARDRIIRIKGDFGTDFCFLAAEPTKAKAGDARFQGTAGMVKDRANGLVLSLLAPGTIEYLDYMVRSDLPVSINLELRTTLVEFATPTTNEQTIVELTLPGSWQLADPIGTLAEGKKKGSYVLTVPIGVTSVTIMRM